MMYDLSVHSPASPRQGCRGEATGPAMGRMGEPAPYGQRMELTAPRRLMRAPG
jgi:hypothetical protein